MPTYDYLCKSCGHEFEAFQSMTAKKLRDCPECDEPALERLIGAGAGVLFKGGGFYETDYRSDSYRKAADADKKAAEGKSDSGKSDGKSDKPADKPDAKADKKTSSPEVKTKKPSAKKSAAAGAS